MLRPDILCHVFQTVSNRRGGSVRPARSAVLGNVLIAGKRDIALSIDVSPSSQPSEKYDTNRSFWEVPPS